MEIRETPQIQFWEGRPREVSYMVYVRRLTTRSGSYNRTLTLFYREELQMGGLIPADGDLSPPLSCQSFRQKPLAGFKKLRLPPDTSIVISLTHKLLIFYRQRQYYAGRQKRKITSSL